MAKQNRIKELAPRDEKGGHARPSIELANIYRLRSPSVRAIAPRPTTCDAQPSKEANTSPHLNRSKRPRASTAPVAATPDACYPGNCAFHKGSHVMMVTWLCRHASTCEDIHCVQPGCVLMKTLLDLYERCNSSGKEEAQIKFA